MNGFIFLDINKPVQSAIFIYLICVLIYLIFFQKKYEEQIRDKKYMFPVIIITLSIVIYYVLKLVQFYFT